MTPGVRRELAKFRGFVEDVGKIVWTAPDLRKKREEAQLDALCELRRRCELREKGF